jgi:hypothetical protein
MPVRKNTKSLIKQVGSEVVGGKPIKKEPQQDLSDEQLLELFSDPVEKKSPDESKSPGSNDLSTPAKQPVQPSSGPGTNKLSDIPVVDPKTLTNPEFQKMATDPNYGQIKALDQFETKKTKVQDKISSAPKVDNAEAYFDKKQEENRIAAKREEELKAVDTGQGKASSGFGTFSQHLFGLPADLLETYAIATDQLGRLFEAGGVEGARGNIEEQEASKLANWYRESVKELYPDNPAYQDEVFTKISASLGDLSGLVATGAVSNTNKAATGLKAFTQESNLVKTGLSEGKKLIATPPALAGAMQMGVNEFHQAKASGATDDQAFDAFIKNAGVGGVLEAIPVMKFFKRLDSTTGGKLKDIIRSGVVQGVDELTTEVVQQVYSNVNASQTYDTTRKWYEGLAGSGGIGFGLGFVLGAMGTSLRKKQSEAKTPEEKAEIQKSIDFVEEKSEELNAKQETISKAESNGDAKTGVEQPVSENVPDQPVSETSIPEADKGVIDVTNLEEIIPKISEEVKNQGLSNSTIEAIDTEISSVSNKDNSFDLELQKQDLSKQLDNPELPADQRGIIEAQINALESTIQNEEVTQDQEGQAKAETIPVQEGQGLEEKPIAGETQPEVGQELIPQTESGVQEPIPQAEETETPETKKRKFIQQVMNDSDISEEFKAGITEDIQNYVPISNQITNKEADAFIEVNGIDNTIEKIFDKKNDIQPRVRITIGEKLIKQLNDSSKDPSINEVEKNRLLDKGIRVADFISDQLREMGQGTQAAAIYAKLSPAGQYRFQKNQIERAGNDKLKPYEKRITQINKLLNQVNQESIKKVLDHPEIQKALSGSVKIKPVGTREAAVKKAIAKLESLKINTKGKAFDVTYALTAEVYNGAISVIQAGLNAGLTISKAIEKGVDYIKKNHSGEWDEEGFRGQFDSQLQEHEVHLEPKRAIQRELKNRQTTIQELVKSHYTKQNRVKKEIVEKLVSDVGLTESEAKELASKIQLEFESIATKAKEQALKKESNVIEKITKENKSIDKKLIELSNLGALNEEAIRKVYSDKLGIKSLSEADGKKIFELADTIQEADNFAEVAEKDFTPANVKKYIELKAKKQKALNEMADLMNQYADKDVWDTLGTVVQGNLLSPISIVTNVYSNKLLQPLRFFSRGIANILDYGYSKAFSRPRKIDIAAAQKGYFKGIKEGAIEGFNQLKTGADIDELRNIEIARGFKPLRAFFKGTNFKENQKVSERINNLVEGTVGIPAEAMFRLLNLGDKPFLRAAELAKAYELASLKGIKEEDIARFIMFPDAESAELIKKAGEEATFKTEDGAGAKASKWWNGFLNWVGEKPVLGGFAKLMLKIQSPYVKTPINIISETLDYAMPGFSLAKAAYYTAKPSVRSREKAMVYFGKAVVGYVLATVIDKLLESGLMSGGPEEEKKERSLQYQAFPPYGVNISALNRMLNGGDPSAQKGDTWMAYNKTGVFNTVAAIRSKMTKEEKESQKEFSDHVIQILKETSQTGLAAASSALEQSFLQNTNTLIEAVKEGDYKLDSWLIGTLRSATSIVLPNTLGAINRASRGDMPELRDPDISKAFLNVLKDKLFLTGDLPSKVDLWGNTIKQTPDGGANSYIYHLFDVTKTRNASADPLSYEIFKLWQRTEENDVIPSIPKDVITVDDVKMKLSTKQYEELQKHIGRTRKALVSAYINSEEYKSSTDEDRISTLKDLYSEGYEEGKDSFINQVLSANQ